MMGQFNQYLRTYLRRYIFTLAILFVLSMGVGFVYAKMFSVDAITIFDVLAEEFDQLGQLGPITTMLVIFFNNAVKTLLVILFGVLLGIAPLIFVFTNGLILGILSYFFYASGQIHFFMMGILPHGVLEVPAFIIASAIGLRLGMLSLRMLFSKVRSQHIRKEMLRGLSIFTHILVPALLLAALIETFITTFILESII